MGTFRNIYKKLVGFLITRPIQRFNVENRAERVLDSDRIRPPPKFEADAKLLERLRQDRETSELERNKDVGLVENMRKFVIQSKGPIEPNEMPKPDNLPKYRGEVNLPQCGHVEPDLVPPGKLTLTMLMSAIDLKHAYHKDHEHIAAELHLSKKDVDDLLYYYKPFASFKQGAKNPKLPKHEFVQQELPAGDSVKQKLPKN